MAEYTYEPLQPGAIRLLLLSPGSGDDPLYGCLEIFPVDGAPEYAAISYVWGEEVFPHKLHLTGGHLGITGSMYAALRSFRRADGIVRLWADQVCISQQSVTEKNHQVSNMADVYRQAEEVLVWLGEARNSDGIACRMLQFLSNFHEQRLIPWGGSFLFDSSSISALVDEFDKYKQTRDGSGEDCVGCNLEPVRDIALSRALQAVTTSIWSRPWFDRLWVVQEVAVARQVSVKFGRHCIDYDDLMDAAHVHYEWIKWLSCYASSRDMFLLERCERVFSLQDGYKHDGPRQRLSDALVRTWDLVAKEDHDRIFAVRALAHVEHNEELKPDYGMSLETLWTQAAVFMLTAPSNWDLTADSLCEPPALCLALPGTQISPSNPSWVPDVRKFTADSFKKYHFYVQEARNFWAGSKMSLNIEYDYKLPEAIKVRGILVGHITRLCHESRDQVNEFQAPESEFEDWWASRDLRSSNYLYACYEFAHGESPTEYREYAYVPKSPSERRIQVGESFCRLMRQGVSESKDLHSESQRAYNATRCLKTGREDLERISSPPLLQRLLSYGTIRETGIPSADLDYTRIMASTSRGHLGWIPDHSQVGDIVCLFQGASFPFILRKRDDGFYTLIGDCYIQGIMNGEAWPNNKEATCMIGLK